MNYQQKYRESKELYILLNGGASDTRLKTFFNDHYFSYFMHAFTKSNDAYHVQKIKELEETISNLEKEKRMLQNGGFLNFVTKKVQQPIPKKVDTEKILTDKQNEIDKYKTQLSKLNEMRELMNVGNSNELVELFFKTLPRDTIVKNFNEPIECDDPSGRCETLSMYLFTKYEPVSVMGFIEKINVEPKITIDQVISTDMILRLLVLNENTILSKICKLNYKPNFQSIVEGIQTLNKPEKNILAKNHKLFTDVEKCKEYFSSLPNAASTSY